MRQMEKTREDDSFQFKAAWHNTRGADLEELKRAREEARRIYGDLLELPYDGVRWHKHMTNDKRAAQFSPFAALTGYEELIDETGRQTDMQAVLSEDRKRELDEMLRELHARKQGDVRVRITWFRKDGRKEGGSYAVSEGRIRRVDGVLREILLENGERIRIKDVTEISALK